MPIEIIMIWPLLRVVQVDCPVLFEVLPRLMKLEAPAIPVVFTGHRPRNSRCSCSACQATLHEMIWRVPPEGELITVCPPMSRPDDLLLGPVANGTSKTDGGLIFSIGDGPVEEGQCLSLRLAVVELAVLVLALAIAIPVGAADFC